MTDFADLVGKTLTKIDVEVGTEVIRFVTSEGQVYRMYHERDCCELVYVEDICGNLNDLLNTPILRASEDNNHDEPPLPECYDESHTWTFYNIATIKGHVTIRWFGTSNGFYSESVSFCLEKSPPPLKAGEIPLDK